MEQETQLLLNDVNRAIIKFRGIYSEWSKKHNISYNEMLVLYTIRENGYCTQKQICEDWLMPKTTVNTLVKELTEKGYAVLENAPGKERYVSLTETGSAYAKEALAKLYSAEIDAVDSVLENFSPDFVDAIERYADILCGKLKTRNE